jgi:hypothetical protein
VFDGREASIVGGGWDAVDDGWRGSIIIRRIEERPNNDVWRLEAGHDAKGRDQSESFRKG